MADKKIMLDSNGRKMVNDILTFSYNSKVQVNSLIGVSSAFNSDGTKIYSNWNTTEEGIGEWDLTTPYNISEMGTSTPDYNLNTEAYTNIYAGGVLFNPDGTKVIIGSYATNLFDWIQYPLSTAWDLSSYGTPTVYNIDSEISSVGIINICWNNDGTKLYGIPHAYGYVGNVRQFSLSTAYDISTISYEKTYTGAVSKFASSTYNYARGIFFFNNGCKMGLCRDDGKIFIYKLTTAWDIATAHYFKEIQITFTGISLFRMTGFNLLGNIALATVINATNTSERYKYKFDVSGLI